MGEIVLSEFQAAVREAHQQSQALQHLYGKAKSAGVTLVCESFVTRRLAQLQGFRGALSKCLATLGLMPTSPDPEEEGFRKLIAEIIDLVSDDPNHPILLKEIRLLQLAEKLLASDEHEADELSAHVENCRIAVETLSTR